MLVGRYGNQPVPSGPDRQISIIVPGIMYCTERWLALDGSLPKKLIRIFSIIIVRPQYPQYSSQSNERTDFAIVVA